MMEQRYIRSLQGYEGVRFMLDRGQGQQVYFRTRGGVGCEVMTGVCSVTGEMEEVDHFLISLH